MATTKSTAKSTASFNRKIQDSVKRITTSRSSASAFLKSAGIMTRNGNLSPKYR